MNPEDEKSNRRSVGWSRRDLLILALLFLFAIQCVRSSFFSNESSGLDWSHYAAGTAPLPYQGRIGMVPVLHWAEHTGWMVHAANRYQAMMVAGARYKEPVTVEKFASLLVGLVAAFVLLGYVVWYGRRRGSLWWLPSVLLLEILTVSMAVRSEHTAWTPYDMPHTALFGLAVMCAFERQWLAMLLLFAVDVPVRETSVFLIAVAAPLAFLDWQRLRGGLARVATLIVGMAAYWEMWQVTIRHRYAHNPSDTGQRLMENLHEVIFPHHWPQLLCVGGYLIIFIWLERRLLGSRERLLLYCTLITAPVTLYFGVWGETRIWLEWSLPWAILAAAEVEQYLRLRKTSAPETMEELRLVS